MTALAVKREDKWVKWSYSEYLSEVEAAARAFIKLGLEPRHGVAIIGRLGVDGDSFSDTYLSLLRQFTDLLKFHQTYYINFEL